MLSNLDFSSSPLGTRILAAIAVLIACAAMSAVVAVFGAMMLLFSADGGGAKDGDWLPRVTVVGGAIGLGVSVLITPLLVLLRVPSPNCYYPAQIGFAMVLGAVMFAVARNVQ